MTQALGRPGMINRLMLEFELDPFKTITKKLVCSVEFDAVELPSSPLKTIGEVLLFK
jgi:hypothetical protein